MSRNHNNVRFRRIVEHTAAAARAHIVQENAEFAAIALVDVAQAQVLANERRRRALMQNTWHKLNASCFVMLIRLGNRLKYRVVANQAIVNNPSYS